jgi:ribosomal protein L44E
MKITFLDENEFFNNSILGITGKDGGPIGSWLIDFVNRDLNTINSIKKYFAIDVQFRYRKVIDWCLSLSPVNLNLIEYSPAQRFFLYLSQVTENSIKSLPNKIDVTYVPNPLNAASLEDIATNMTSQEAFEYANKNNFSLSEIYVIDNDDISSLCYIEFMQMVKNEVGVRRCKCCDNYFLITGRIDTEYCLECKETGAKKIYHDKVKNNEFLKLYQREYQRLYAKIRHTSKTVKASKGKLLTAWAEKITAKIKENEMVISDFTSWLKEEGKNLEKELVASKKK